MLGLEEKIVEDLRGELVRCLDLQNNVLDYYYSNGRLSDLKYGDIISYSDPKDRNELFLDEVKRTRNLQLFIEALEFEDTHSRLAARIKQILSLSEGRIAVLLDQPSRAFTKCGKMRKLIKMNFRLRELTSKDHLSRHQEFQDIIQMITNRHGDDSDFLFHMYDAELSFRRMFYQKSPKQDILLNKMELVCRRTKHPAASRMVYLARKGSVLAMRGDLDGGLEYLKEAKAQASTLHPYKDTGMVQYIEINLLLQKYEQDPDSETKEHIISNTLHAVECDFADEDISVKDCYSKIMYLKRALCYLGIGVSCSIMSKCMVDEDDCSKADDCLAKLEVLPGQLYNRHRMFYNFAHSYLAFQRGRHVSAVVFGTKALEVAERSEYVKELTMIREYMDIITWDSF